MHSTYQLTAEQMSKLLHDIRGPMTTTLALKGEILEVIDDLSSLIDSIDSELSNESLNKINDLIDNDLRVCARHMEQSVGTLQTRVSQFTGEFPPIVDDSLS